MTDLVTFGEALVSFRTGAIAPGWAATAHVAGAESNVAIGLARLGHAARWAGRVSSDRLGDWVVDTLASEGVDTAWVTRDDVRPAGVMVLEAPSDQARRVTYVRRGSAGSTLDAADVLGAVVGARRLHLTGVTPALGEAPRRACREAAAAAAAAGVAVSLDVNYRPALWSQERAAACLRELLEHVSTVVASEDELHLVADGPESDAVRALLADGAREVVIKRGERGAGIYWAEGSVELPAAPVAVVDVIGAGDALCAGLLSGLLDGLDAPGALGRGMECAGACVASAGDWEGLPHRSSLMGTSGSQDGDRVDTGRTERGVETGQRT